MTWQNVDWNSLERLRACFLEGSAAARDYWTSETDLVSYDLTFAQRIGWKWDWVLEDLVRQGWQPPAGTMLDWGCGTGIAHRAFFHHYGTRSTPALHVWDRSRLAMGFAARRANEKHPEVAVRTGLCESPALLLISHVLTELSQDEATALAEFAARATAVIWVEPGAYETSLALIAIRERLRQRMSPVAPCPHAGACGILAAGNERHWCHHFATPPGGVFTDGHWARFAKLLGIDLRSLPLSYLVLDARPPAVRPEGSRVIGRARVYKAHALILGCQESGVAEHRLDKRAFPEAFRELKKNRFASRQHWTSSNGVVTGLRPLPR